MDKKKLLKNIIIATFGVIILGTGIGMMTKVGLGTDGFTAVLIAIGNITGLSLGTITALANATLLVVALILSRKHAGIATVLFIFVAKYPIDIAQNLMITSDSLIINIILCLISLLVMAFGSALFIKSDLGANAYDAVTLGIYERVESKMKYVALRYICDGTCFVLALILKGPIGIGTVLSLAFIGIFLKFWQGVLDKIIH